MRRLAALPRRYAGHAHQEEVDAEEVSCDRATAMHARTHMHTHVW